MKKFIFLFLLIGASLRVHAQSFPVTPHYRLCLPPVGATGWGPCYNANSNIIDGALWALATPFQGAWSSTVTYTNGQYVTYSGQVYLSTITPNLNHIPGSSSQWQLIEGSGAPGGPSYSIQYTSTSGLFAGASLSGIVVASTTAAPRIAMSSDIIALFASGTCSGFMRGDNTCPTIIPPSGGGTGVASLTGIRYANGSSADSAATGTQIADILGTTSLTLANIGPGQAQTGTYDFSTATQINLASITALSGGTSYAFLYDNAAGKLAYSPVPSGDLNNFLFPCWHTSGFSSIDNVLACNSGQIPFSGTGDLTGTIGTSVVSRVHGVIFPASPNINTVPVVTTGGGSPAVTYEAVPNAALAFSSTTVNGQTCTLGSTCTITAVATSIAGLVNGDGTTISRSGSGTSGSPYIFSLTNNSFTLGSTSISLGSTVTSVAGLTVNGVSLSTSAGSGNYLNGAGSYAQVTYAQLGGTEPVNAITALTGDGTASGTGSVAFTLATVNSTPGACGDSTHVCAVTTNGKGLTTAQSAIAIAFPSSTVAALTINSSGSGAASPATFNGSTAVTISYNTLGAAGIAATNIFTGPNTFNGNDVNIGATCTATSGGDCSSYNLYLAVSVWGGGPTASTLNCGWRLVSPGITSEIDLDDICAGFGSYKLYLSAANFKVTGSTPSTFFNGLASTTTTINPNSSYALTAGGLKLGGIANGTLSTDVAAFGQIPTTLPASSVSASVLETTLSTTPFSMTTANCQDYGANGYTPLLIGSPATNGLFNCQRYWTLTSGALIGQNSSGTQIFDFFVSSGHADFTNVAASRTISINPSSTIALSAGGLRIASIADGTSSTDAIALDQLAGANTCGTHQFFNAYSGGSAAIFTCVQPASTDISGLGTMATQNSSSVSITGGTISVTSVIGSTYGTFGQSTGASSYPFYVHGATDQNARIYYETSGSVQGMSISALNDVQNAFKLFKVDGLTLVLNGQSLGDVLIKTFTDCGSTLCVNGNVVASGLNGLVGNITPLGAAFTTITMTTTIGNALVLSGNATPSRSPLNINAGASGNYNEGIRIESAADGYSMVVLGAVAGGFGTGAGQWMLVQQPVAQSYLLGLWYNATSNVFSFSTTGDFTAINSVTAPTGTFSTALYAGGTGSGNLVCTQNGTNCPAAPAHAQTMVWNVQPGLFATATMLSGTFYVPSTTGLSQQRLAYRTSGSISCVTGPTGNIMDLGTSNASGNYASATSVQFIAMGTTDNASEIVGGLSLVAGHYYGFAFSAGTCVTAPTVDVTVEIW